MSHNLAHWCQAQHAPLSRADIAIVFFLVRNETLAFEIVQCFLNSQLEKPLQFTSTYDSKVSSHVRDWSLATLLT